MIAHLRRRHRAMVTTTFLTVLCLFVWAMAARKSVPHVPVAAGAGKAAAP